MIRDVEALALGVGACIQRGPHRVLCESFTYRVGGSGCAAFHSIAVCTRRSTDGWS
jgi:hypothetical protein